MTLLPPQAAVVAAAARASGDPPARPCGEALGTDRRPPAIATPNFDVCLPLRQPDLRVPSAQENAHEKDLGSPARSRIRRWPRNAQSRRRSDRRHAESARCLPRAEPAAHHALPIFASHTEGKLKLRLLGWVMLLALAVSASAAAGGGGGSVKFTLPINGTHPIIAFGAQGAAAGGGGGSFVVGPDNTPLVIAGAGGRCGFRARPHRPPRP